MPKKPKGDGKDSPKGKNKQSTPKVTTITKETPPVTPVKPGNKSSKKDNKSPSKPLQKLRMLWQKNMDIYGEVKIAANIAHGRNLECLQHVSVERLLRAPWCYDYDKHTGITTPNVDKIEALKFREGM